MPANGRVCAVTGANGYIGGVVTDCLRREGWKVLALVRPERAARTSDESIVPFSLEGGVDPERLKNVDALVHCAYDFRQLHWQDIHRVNVEGALRALDAASAAGIPKMIFVSSIAAFEGCHSLYGKAKLEIETRALKAGAGVIRPGLVYGKRAGGLFGTLQRIVARSSLVPLINHGEQTTCLAHEEDVGHLISTLLRRSSLPARPISAGSEKRKTFRQLLEAIGEVNGKKLVFVPIPSKCMLLGLRMTEAAGLRPGFTSDNLISFLNPNPRPDFAVTREIGVPFREFSADNLAR